MAQEVGVEIKAAITRGNGNNLRSETITMWEFFDSNGISWQAPGRKDIICTVHQDG